MSFLYTALSAFEKTILATHCASCSRKGEKVWCSQCQHKMLRRAWAGQSLGNSLALFPYTEEAITPIAELREAKRLEVLYFFVPFMTARLAHTNVDLIVTAPQRAQKFWAEETFLEQLAGALAAELSVTFVPRIFRKVAENQRSQTAKGRVDREPFLRLRKKCPEDWKEKKILILDDVTTSGTTLQLCEYLLREQGVQKIHSLALFYRPIELEKEATGSFTPEISLGL